MEDGTRAGKGREGEENNLLRGQKYCNLQDIEKGKADRENKTGNILLAGGEADTPDTVIRLLGRRDLPRKGAKRHCVSILSLLETSPCGCPLPWRPSSWHLASFDFN